MSVEGLNHQTPGSQRAGESGSSDNNTVWPRLLATTNYGAQVAYNYGSISNYFCHSSDAAHRCHFPEISSKNYPLGDQLYTKIERARDLYKSKSWQPAKALLYEVLHAPYAALAATERLLLQYNLAHTHFALAEFSEAARQFQDLLDTYQERNETAEKSVGDSRYWLARSFYHLERHADASEEFQFFILIHNQEDADGAEQVTTARLWLGLTFERLRQYGLAKEQLSAAFEERVQNLGSEHLDTLACRHHLANFSYKRKAYAEALEHFQALLLVEDNLSGPEKGEAMRTRCMLALCLAKTDQYDEAEPHLERVLARLDASPYLTLYEARDAGLVCYWLGRILFSKMKSRAMDQAAFLFQRAMQLMSTSIRDSNDNKNVTTMQDPDNDNGNSLGHDDDLQDELVGCRCYQAHAMLVQGQFVAAEHAYRQILDAKIATREDYLIASRHGLARCLMNLKKIPEAKVVLEEAVSAVDTLEGCLHTGDDLGACTRALGDVHMELKQYHEARECFQRVVDAKPKKPNECYSWSQLMLGAAYFRLRQFESARSHFHEAYRAGVENFSDSALQLEAECWLAWSLCEVGNYDEAEVHLRPALTMLPSSQEGHPIWLEDFLLGYSYFYKGRVALHRRNIVEASNHFRASLVNIGRCEGLASQHYLECRYFLAYSLFMIKNYEEARGMFEELQKTESCSGLLPDIRLVLAPFWLAIIAHKAERLNESEAYLTLCLNSLRGTVLPLHPELSVEHVKVWHANSQYYLCRFDECSEIVRGILAGVDDTGVENDRADLYIESRMLLGQSLYMLERFEEACGHLRMAVTALEARPGLNDDGLWFTRALLADSLSEVHRHDEAATYLLQLGAVQDPGINRDRKLVKAIATYWLGRRAFRTDKFGQPHAEAHFTNTQRILLGLGGARWKHMLLDCQHFLARLQLRVKNHADADDVFRQLARQQYESGDRAQAVDNQYWLGYSLYMQDKTTDAIPVFQKIVSDNRPGRLEEFAIAASHQAIGHCFFWLGKFKEAGPYYESALQYPNLDSDTFNARLYLAQCNFKTGMYEKAKAGFQSCLEQITYRPDCTMLVRYWLGRTLFELREWGPAETNLEIAALDESKNRLSNANALSAQYYVGRARFAAGKYQDALSPLLGIQSKFATNPSPMVALSQYYVGLAWYENGEFAASRRKLLEVLSKFRAQKPQPIPDIRSTDFWQARCLVGLGADVKAKTELERIIGIPWYKLCAKPNDQTIMLAQYDLARIAYRAKDWTRALECFQAALVRHGEIQASNSTLDVFQCQRYMAITFQVLQREDEAANLYSKIFDNQTAEIAEPQRVSLLDLQICLSHTLYRLEKRRGYSDTTEEARNFPGALSGSNHPYNVRRQILLADLAFRLRDFHRAGELYGKLLALMDTSDEARNITPVPVAYLRAAMAITLSQLGKTDEARNHAARALEADCFHTHSCTSLDGFTEAFPELLSSATCTEPAHGPTVHTSPATNSSKLRVPAKKPKRVLSGSQASSARLNQLNEKETLDQTSQLLPEESGTSTEQPPSTLQPQELVQSAERPPTNGQSCSLTIRSLTPAETWGSFKDQSPHGKIKNAPSQLLGTPQVDDQPRWRPETPRAAEGPAAGHSKKPPPPPPKPKPAHLQQKPSAAQS